MTLTEGSLCTGYNGLGLAVESVLGAELAWYSEVEKAPCRILEHRYPGVPNLGDLTVLDWSQVEPVDILTAGFPCQPFSHAGKRQGAHDERHLWPYIVDAIRVLRPGLVVLENVSGLLSADGGQPDCVCGWNYRWGRQLVDLVDHDQQPNALLAGDGGADGEAARSERSLSAVQGAAGGGATAGSRARGDAAVGNVGYGGLVPTAAHDALPDGEAGTGSDHRGHARAVVALVGERSGDRVDSGDLSGMGGGTPADGDPECPWSRRDGWVACPACGRPVDDGAERPVRGALGVVLGDLAQVGFRSEWTVVRASDVGACHQRARLFIVARDTNVAGLEGRLPVRGGGDERAARPPSMGVASDTSNVGHERVRDTRGRRSGLANDGDVAPDAGGERHGGGQDPGGVGRVDGEDAGGARERERAREAPRHRSATTPPDTSKQSGEFLCGGIGYPRSPRGSSREGPVQQPGRQGASSAPDPDGGGRGLGSERDSGQVEPRLEPSRRGDVDGLVAWGDYEPAIRRAERAAGRPAPVPVDDKGRLSPRFVEWMQLLPEGWVTDILTNRTHALKALGNGVVPPQAAYAILGLLQRLNESSRVAA